MSISKIQKAVFTKLAASAGLPQIIYPNISTPTPTGNHIRVFVLPAITEAIGIEKINWASGIIQASIYCKDGVGAIVAADIADTVIALFPRGTVMTNGGLSIRVDSLGYAGPAITEGGWYQIPVSIPYNALV
jgi:hypothetical protein